MHPKQLTDPFWFKSRKIAVLHALRRQNVLQTQSKPITCTKKTRMLEYFTCNVATQLPKCRLHCHVKYEIFNPRKLSRASCSKLASRQKLCCSSIPMLPIHKYKKCEPSPNKKFGATSYVVKQHLMPSCTNIYYKHLGSSQSNDYAIFA